MYRINKDKCIGCGICANICPDGISMQGNKAIIVDVNAKCMHEAASKCPVNCIIDGGNPSVNNNISNSNNTFSSSLGMGSGRGAGSGGGMGSGRGGGTGSGPSGYCVCPKCGYKVEHGRGTPCYKSKCPKCNTIMTRS